VTCSGRGRAAIKRITNILPATNPRDKIVNGAGVGTCILSNFDQILAQLSAISALR
jgi:hypothetical protein